MTNKALPISVGVGVALIACFLVLGGMVTAGSDFTTQLNAVGANAIQSLRSDELNPFVFAFTSLADPQVVIAVSVLTLFGLWLAKRKDFLTFMFLFFAVCMGLIYSLKAFFNVERPIEQMIIPIPPTASFPSAHAGCALMLALMFGVMIATWLAERHGKSTVRDVVVIGILVVIALLIGLSRVYVGVHWCTDVIGGWLIASASAIPVITWFKLNDTF